MIASNLPFNLEELAEFLVRAKKSTYAGDGREVVPERHGFKELEYKEGDWSYRDSYAGFFIAPGQEVVRFREEPIWAMAYTGGMNQLVGNVEFAKRTFKLLKLALSQVEPSAPFRGPASRLICLDNFKYLNIVSGRRNIIDFEGFEEITCRLESFDGEAIVSNIPVFSQKYFGGLILPKSYKPNRFDIQ